MMFTVRLVGIGLAAMAGLSAQELPLPGLAMQQSAPRVTRTVTNMRTGSTYLGVGVVEVTEERAKALNLKDAHGVEVKHVEENSPAAKAGVKEGDVVLDYNGQRVEGVEQFIRLISETPAGRKANLNVWRNGSAQTLSPVLEMKNRSMNTMVIRMPDVPMPPSTPELSTSIRSMMNDQFSTMSLASPRVGIEAESLTGQLADFFGVKQGVLVRSVTAKSPAEKAGMKAGDVIIKIGGTPVMTPREITGAVRNAKGKVSITVVRSRKEVTLEVEMPENHGAMLTPDRLVLE